MHKGKSIMGSLVHSFNKCAPVSGSGLRLMTILEGRNGVSAGLQSILALTPSVVAKYLTGKEIRTGETKTHCSGGCKGGEEDPGSGAG